MMPSTRDHKEIQRWAEKCGAVPSIVDETGGLLRFDFDLEDDDPLTQTSWEEFFEIFDDRGLTLVYSDDPKSRFHKFVYETQ
jgi:hypothetical protein